MKFTQPVSMHVSEKQFEEDLRQPLIDLGYRIRCLSDFSEMPIITTNLDGTNNNVFVLASNILETLKKKCDRYFINHYNPELFLALAAMTDNSTGIKGEWWKCINPGGGVNFTKGKLYQQIVKNYQDIFAFKSNRGIDGWSDFNDDHFVKPTKEEIINQFTNKKPVMKKEKRFPFELNEKDYKKIIKAACVGWREKLVAKWGVFIAIDGYTKVTEDFYKEMREACTPEQHILFDEIFGKDEPKWTLADAKDGEPVWVKIGDANAWQLRYANGKGEVYFDQKKFGDTSTWSCAMPFDPNNLPVN
jgi:hypothetical protein